MRLRVPIVAALVALAAYAAAGTYTIRLSTFPSAEVADGHSQITITAQVYSDGRAVTDGTQVMFETDLGSFRQTIVNTTGGLAQGILIAGGVPGTAHIKARALAGDSSASTCEVELVKNREELSAARETIEATSTGSLLYANDVKVLEGVAPDKGVTIHYRDLEIHADQVQVNLSDFTLKAKKATVRRGRRTILYDSYFLDLTNHTGYGLTTYMSTRPDSLMAYPGGLAFVEFGPDGESSVAQPRMRFGMVAVGREQDHPLAEPLAEDPFAMVDISGSPSTVGSRKAVVYARREIQFHKADIFVNNQRVLKFPLFVVNLAATSNSPLVTDDLLSINDNQVALNYPQYLTLQPGLTSLLRFTTGQRYGESLSSNHGAFLNYELSWSKGDEMQGGFTLGGVGRNDWVASMHQFWRVNQDTTANFELDTPTGKSVLGTASLTHNLGAYNLSANASQSQTINGSQIINGVRTDSSSQFFAVSLDRNPDKIPHLPLRFTYGLTADDTRSTGPSFNSLGKIDGTETFHQSGAGFASRLFSDALRIDHSTTLNSSFGATKLFGPDAYRQVSLNGSLSLNHRLSKTATALVTYNYLHDGLNEHFVGTHSVGLIGNVASGNTGLRLAFNKGLGVDRLSLSGEASYRLSSVWRVSYSNYFNQYRNDDFSDFYYILGYRIGWREVGLTWSRRSKRPGFELMNVNF